MKKNTLQWVALLIFCLIKSTTLQACTDPIIHLAQKFYLQSHQIHFSDNKIYIHVGDVTYETPSILSDHDGYYIEKVARSGDCSWTQWQCSRSSCKTCNLRGIDWSCRACGKPISG